MEIKKWKGVGRFIRQAWADACAHGLAGEELRANNPGAEIESGVRLLGGCGKVSLAEGVVLESGAVIDMRLGGSIALGQGTIIRRGAILSPWGGWIQTGEECSLNHYSILYGHGGLTIGNFVRIAAHCVMIPANHGMAPSSEPMCRQPLSKKGIRLGDDIWIGAGVVVLDGVGIGNGAVIAAGAVVAGDVEPNTIVGGVPARELRRRGA